MNQTRGATRRRRRLIAAVGFIVALGVPLALVATPFNRMLLFEAYPEAPISAPHYASSVATCNTCHFYGAGPARNAFGEAWVEAGYDFSAIADLDSDSDGISNGDEIAAGTNPGASPEDLARRLLGYEDVPADHVNVNGDRQESGEEILDAADLVFRFQK